MENKVFAKMLRFLSILFLIVVFTYPTTAQTKAERSSIELLSSEEKAGDLNKIKIMATIKLKDGWKTYWRTPGEAGLPPVFDWSGSVNLKHAKVLFPAPMRFKVLDIDNFGYEKEVSFPIILTPKEKGKGIFLNLNLEILVCNKLCVPEYHGRILFIPKGKAIETTHAYKVFKAFDSLPKDSLKIYNNWISEEKDNLLYFNTIVKHKSLFSKDTDLFIEDDNFITFDKPIIIFNKNNKTSHFKSRINFDGSFDEIKALFAKEHAILTITDKKKSFENRITIKDSTSKKKHLTLYILALAFIGGLILNLMPCVLPVLSIKIMSVLKYSGEDSTEKHWDIFKEFTATFFGIIFSFWLIATMLIILKYTGHSIGWGMQFQEPIFIVFLILVVLLFSANMWGLFEIKLPKTIASKTPNNSFLTGMFATLLATPCSAPFLGTAISFALAGSPITIFIVFNFLGLGLAFPYLLLALRPGVFRYFPKPGKWMVVLKKTLSMFLILTAAWLFNVLLAIYTPAEKTSGWDVFNKAALSYALAENKIVLVDVTSEWCLTCKANKFLVLETSYINEAIKKYSVLKLQADWTNKNKEISEYLKSHNKYGVPFNIVYGPNAKNGIILGEILTKKALLNAFNKAK